MSATYTDYVIPEMLSNYISDDPMYGLPPFDPKTLLSGDTSQTWIPQGDTGLWAYHVTAKVWCIVGLQEKLAILGTYSADQSLKDPNRCKIVHNAQIDLQNVSKITDSTSQIPTSSNSIEVFVEKLGITRPAGSQNQIFVATNNGNVFLPADSCVSTLLSNPGGSTQIWNMSLQSLYELLNTSDDLNEPINFTGRTAVLAAGNSGPVWVLGRMQSMPIIPNQFAAVLGNYNPNNLQTQAPPTRLGNYTLPLSNYWAYHIVQQIWYEVDAISFIRIRIANVNSNINYVNNTMPDWAYQNATTIDGIVTSGQIQVFWTKLPDTILGDSLYDGVPFSQAKYPGSAFVNETNPAGLLVQTVLDVFIPIWQEQVILEPVNNNGNIVWIATTAAFLLSKTITRKMTDPIYTTGYLAILKNNVWILGRNSLNGSGLNKVNDFASVITDSNAPLPPDQVGSRSLNGNRWAYHVAHMVWYEIDLDSQSRIQLNNISTSIKYKSSSIIPMLNVNKTGTLDPKIVTPVNDIEVFIERISTSPPAVSTLRYPGQIAGTFLTGDTKSSNLPASIFGVTDALLPAFNAVPSQNQAAIIWDYESNDWRAMCKDQLIAEIISDNGNINYSSTTIDLVLFSSRVSAVDLLIVRIQDNLNKINLTYEQSQINNQKSVDVWKTPGLSGNRVQEAQTAADLVASAMNSIANLYQNLLNSFNGIVNRNNAYANAKSNIDLNSLFNILTQLQQLDATVSTSVDQANNYLITSNLQTSIAIDGIKPTTIFTIYKSAQSAVVNFGIKTYRWYVGQMNQGFLAYGLASIKNFYNSIITNIQNLFTKK